MKYVKTFESFNMVNDSNKFNPNIPFLKEWSQVVINPGGDNNQYDNLAPKDWDVDQFNAWVKDYSDGDLIPRDKDVIKLLGIEGEWSILDLNNGGSGYNNNEYFKQFKNWVGAIYDVWTYLKNFI